MKITKKLEKEILAVIDDYWGSYLKGDLQTWASYLPDNYLNIGTTKEEIWSSKKEIVDYTEIVIDQMVSMAEVRNKKTQIFPIAPYFMVHELGDLFIKVEKDWTFYAPVRVSSVLEKTKDGWKILHQHGSYPDSKTEEGEAFAFDELKAENKKLRDAIQSRTIELEQKNRELEIETALERVRSRTMAMHSSDELLETGAVLFKELSKLGVKIFNCGYVLMDDKAKIGWNYGVNPGDGSIRPLPTGIPQTGTKVLEAITASWKKQEPLLLLELDLQETMEHQTYIAENMLNFSLTKEQLLARSPERLVIYTFNFKHGYLLLVDGVKLTADQQEMVKRFANVFEQTYRRYLDLVKAEAQAREAQIEAAMEKIRSRSMAMHKSDELKDVVKVLNHQLNSFGLAEWGCSIMIFDKKANHIENWVSESTNSELSCYIIEGQRHPVYKNLWEHWEYQAPTITLHHTDDVKREFDNFWLYKTDYIQLPEEVKASVLSEREVYLTYSSMLHGLISIAGYKPLSGDQISILDRFTKVFEQTYTRFLDLQKAEAQTREAQIEAAVERVRAQSMAMHHSDDLDKVNKEILNQLNWLQVSDLTGVTFYLTDEHGWVKAWDFSSPGNIGNPNSYTLQYDFNKYEMMGDPFRAFRQTDLNYYVADYPLEKLERAVYELEEINPTVAKVLKEALAKGILKHQWTACARISDGLLGIDLVSPPSDVTKTIALKIAGAFNQAYQRFLDLQRAEAQTREAQIEAALERVRSKSLAMHKSTELRKVVNTLYGEFTNLGVNFNVVVIQLLKDKTKDLHLWISTADGLYDDVIHWPYVDIRNFNEMYPASTTQSPLAITLDQEETKVFFDEYFKVPGVPPGRKEAIKSVRQIDIMGNYQQHTGIFLMRYAEGTYSDYEKDITQRFSKVFEQAYTRFLDLQRAEAQTREAQIEAALERVRAQTMAMHNSEDIGKCIIKMFDELTALGVDEDARFGIGILNHDNENNQLWTASKDGKEVKMHIGNLDMTLHPLLKSARKAWKAQVPLHQYVLEGEDLLNYYQVLNDAPDYPLPIAMEKLPERQFHYGFVFEQGFFYAFSPHEFQPELIHITQRFSSQFAQTYRRYLDLVKAEAQAREAEISLALERVRARTLAMQRSEELIASSLELWKQVEHLGIPAFGCGFNIWDADKKFATAWMGGKERTQPSFKTDSSQDIFKRIYEAERKGESLFVEIQEGEAIKEHYAYMTSIPVFKNIADEMSKAGLSFPDFQIMHCVFFAQGYLMFITFEPVPWAYDIFKRFGKVFEQTYTRFLDLQKAETQAREAQIEAALERIRARSMAMHKSEELAETASLLFKQIGDLGLDVWSSGFQIWNADDISTTAWMYTVGGEIQAGLRLPHTEDPFFQNIHDARHNPDGFFVMESKGKELEKTYRYMFNIPEWKKAFGDIEASGFPVPKYQITHCVFFPQGYLMLITHKSYPEYWDIFKRFGKVFEQTYTRFLDLQRAEAQTREAQINLAVERVRARALAMFKSEEILEVVFKLKEEIMGLDIPGVAAATILLKNENGMYRNWDLTSMEQEGESIHLPLDITFDLEETHPDFYLRKVWSNGKNYTVVIQDLKSLQITTSWLRDNNKIKEADEADHFIKTTGIQQVFHPTIPLNNGRMCIDLVEAPSNEIESILLKMGSAFDLAYKRFEDLQKAEAQAREAQIEAALERTRTQSMLMQHSDELNNVSNVFHEQLLLLGLPSEFSYVWLPEEASMTHMFWATWSENNNGTLFSHSKAITYPLDKSEPYTAACYEMWESDQSVFVNRILPEEVADFFSSWQELVSEAENMKEELFPDGLYYAEAYMKYGCFGINIRRPLSEEEQQVLHRFSIEFERAYTRFLDLKKAEAQARESRIEAALEKVRSRTMAMHKAEELHDVVSVVVEKLVNLGVTLDSNGVVLCTYFPNSRNVLHWIASPDFSFTGSYLLPYFDHPIFSAAWESKLSGDEYFSKSFSVEEKNSFWAHAFENSDYRYFPEEFKEWVLQNDKHALSFAWSKNSAILIPSHTGIVPTAEDAEILKRFAKVFEQAYVRFMDLQKAEKQAKEALKQAALDRVRGEIASMRSTEDLKRITPVIWRELTSLDVPFIRCGVFIVDEASEVVEVYLTTPGGEALGVLHLPFDVNTQTTNTVKYWRENKVYREHWDANAFTEWTQSMIEMGQVENFADYQGAAKIPDELHLHFVPFKQGMLYVGDIIPLPDEKIELVKTLAEAFAIAYARYEDFVRLEEAKSEIETALAELKATQAQLIQSEKMASLGELTAGIAHEIQNPLNFVNNFSEVTNELIEEMKEEMDKGDLEEARALAEDIKKNLEKIHHHGGRADAIVKGMLQHSRQSTAEKTATDINKLADEYLRLAYHGLRAKDKSFNVTLNTDFDPTLTPIMVIPQDIGRVILNLITNAFYACAERSRGAVREKKISNGKDYQPTVTMSTQKMEDHILIAVEDNGNGIPQQVLDKIFQPFFTTKPTGQGTGLGLSLSYDIIKAHEGKMEVETEEGTHTVFRIILPNKK